MKLGQKYKNVFVGFLVQMKTFKFAFEINWPLKLSLSFLNKAVDNNDNSSLKTFVQELSNADPTLYLSHQHLHDLCKFEKNFENTGKFNQEPHYFEKFEFPRQKIICPFGHLKKQCATKGLVVWDFFSRLFFLSNFNEKLLLKKIGGNYELFEILVFMLTHQKFGFLI